MSPKGESRTITSGNRVLRFDCERYRLTRGAVDSNKSAAFTLAEVLITLGIIGVVAAITMPTIIANVRDKSLESAYKKAQSSLINGYKLLMGKESIIDVKNLELMKCSDKNCMSSYHKSTFNVVQDNTDGLNSNAMPQDYLAEDGSANVPFSWSNVPYLFRTADGMNYGVEIENDDENQSILVYADVNGNKTPNTVCKDMYKFRISGTGQIVNVCGELATNSGCSLNNISACSYDECMAIPKATVIGTDGCTMSNGGWAPNGHYINFNCNSNGNHYVDDYCEDAKTASWHANNRELAISTYCR